jgi:hypothetical protein
MVLDASTVNGKRSLHVMDRNHHLANIADMRIYYEKFKAFIHARLEDYPCMRFIDFSVCSKNRLMRMAGSSKIKDPARVLRPCKTYHRPTKLSVDFFATHVEDSIKISIKKPPVKKPKILSTSQNDPQTPSYNDTLETCKLLINGIKPAYSINRSDWFAIGSALHTALNGNQDGLDLWILHSKKNIETLDVEECKQEWSKGMSDKYTPATLLWYFKRK